MPRHHFRRLALILTTFLVAFLGAHGATWVLVNGDRLNGKLVKETDAAIEIEHPQLGRMTIPRTGLQGATTDSTLAVAQVSAAPLPSSGTPAAKATPTVASRPQWTRQIEFGLVMQEGAKTTRDLSLRGQVEGRLGSNSLRGTARVLRSESEGVVTRNRDEADFRWRHDFNRRTFAQALTNYNADDIRNIDYSIEQQLGGGYRLVDRERQKMNVGLGAVFQWQARKGYDDNAVLLGSLFQDYAFSWNDRFKVTQESSLQFADEPPAILRNSATPASAPSDGNYRFKFNTALQSKMTDQVSLNLRFEYDYDHSISEPVLRSDSRLTTSLGYAW
ncbi:MAG: hypothetical protein C0518_11420 [Opitutus sp.]|nr:hypothetical protein [Opitutus sp.]